MSVASEVPFSHELPRSPTRQRVLETLDRISTPKHDLGAYYLGGLWALEAENNPDHVSQSANSFRELIEKLYVVTPLQKEEGIDSTELRKQMLEKFQKCQKNYGASWKGEISAELSDLLQDLNSYLIDKPLRNRKGNLHKIIEFSDQMSGHLPSHVTKERQKALEALSDFFQKAAHHSREYAGLLELREKVRLVETLILNYFAPSTAEHGKRLRKLGGMPCNSELLNEAVELIRIKGANHVAFFESLQDTSWLQPLWENKCFRQPEEERNKNGGRGQYWVEGFCLVRLFEKDPNAVIDIIKQLPLVRNGQLDFNISQIAQKISSPEQTEHLLGRLCEGAKNQGKWHGSELGIVLSRWVKIGAVNQALILLKQITTFYPDPKADEKKQLPRMEYALNQIEPIVPFDSWDFSQILSEHSRDVIKASPLQTAGLLIDSLCNLLRLRADRQSHEDGQDWSNLWCDTLPESSGHLEPDRALVHATLTSCEEVFTNQHDLWHEIHAQLKKQKSLIFRRLRWFLYARHVEASLSPIREEVLSINHQYGIDSYQDEFAEMIHCAATKCGGLFLSSGEWQNLRRRIADGVEQAIAQESKNKDFSSEKADWRRGYLLYKALRPFEPILPLEEKPYFDALGLKYAEIFAGYNLRGGGSVVQKSPKEWDDLGKMTNADLARYLNEWEGDGRFVVQNGEWLDISVSGLATAFAQLVQKDLDRFVAWPDWWKEIRRPIFMRKYLDVGQSIVKEKKPIDDLVWCRFLDLCEWIIEKATQQNVETHEEERESSEESSENADYEGSETSVIFFIREALRTSDMLPSRFRERVFTIIKSMATQADRKLDKKIYESSVDMLYIAADSVRGAAISLLAEYGFWIRRTISNKDKVPEIWPVLENRLSPAVGEHPAIFAAIMEQIRPWFIFDAEWVKTNQGFLFSQKQDNWDASWSAYLRAAPASGLFFNIFKHQFERGIKLVPHPLSEKASRHSDDERLGYRLVLLAWQGSIPIQTGILKDFYDKSPSAVRVEVARSILMTMNQQKSISAENLMRIQKFVEWRLGHLLKPVSDKGFWNANRDETEMYPKWFESEFFSTEWRLSQLLQYAEKTDSFDTTDFNIDSLIELLPLEVNRITKILLTLLQKTNLSTHIYWKRDDLKTAINYAIKDGNEAARADAEDAKNLLLNSGRMGLSDFDDTPQLS